MTIDICGYFKLYLCVLTHYCFKAHDFYLKHYNLRGYLQLQLCVALGSSMDSSLNAYAVFIVFMQTLQFMIFATQKKGLQ